VVAPRRGPPPRGGGAAPVALMGAEMTVC